MHIILVFLIIFFQNSVTELQVDHTKKNLVRFISDAPIENFEGITNNIDGYIYFEQEDFTNNSELYFEVDLRTIDTGIGLRNRHMRDNYLETDQYPFTFFTGKIISAENISGDFKAIVQGDIFIHGMKKNIEVEGIIKESSGAYKISTNFEIKLSDFNIDIPEVMFLKLNEIIKLELEFFMVKIENE